MEKDGEAWGARGAMVKPEDAGGGCRQVLGSGANPLPDARIATLLAARSFCLKEALTQSAYQAAGQIERDFHDLDVAAIVREFARLPAECLAIMVATTGIGALLGGVAGFFGGFGAGAAPGARRGRCWAWKRENGYSPHWA